MLTIQIVSHIHLMMRVIVFHIIYIRCILYCFCTRYVLLCITLPSTHRRVILFRRSIRTSAGTYYKMLCTYVLYGLYGTYVCL